MKRLQLGIGCSPEMLDLSKDLSLPPKTLIERVIRRATVTPTCRHGSALFHLFPAHDDSKKSGSSRSVSSGIDLLPGAYSDPS